MGDERVISQIDSAGWQSNVLWISWMSCNARKSNWRSLTWSSNSNAKYGCQFLAGSADPRSVSNFFSETGDLYNIRRVSGWFRLSQVILVHTKWTRFIDRLQLSDAASPVEDLWQSSVLPILSSLKTSHTNIHSLEYGIWSAIDAPLRAQREHQVQHLHRQQ